jgi:hypothetical protein
MPSSSTRELPEIFTSRSKTLSWLWAWANKPRIASQTASEQAIVNFVARVGFIGNMETASPKVRICNFVANSNTFVKALFPYSPQDELPASELGTSADLFGKFTIMGSYDQGYVTLLIETKKQVLNLLADTQIQRARGLVGEQ